MTLPWVYDDGGRATAGYKGTAGDCVVRAIAIAADLDYGEIYSGLSYLMRQTPSKARGKSTPRDGVPMPIVHQWLRDSRWIWTPTMGIGTGCTTHLRRDELPTVDRMIVRVTRHICAVVDGVVRDTSDPGRAGTRCVYGYWIPGEASS